MTADQLRSLLRALVYLAVVLVPIVFWRGVTNAFDLTKATVFAALAVFALVALAWLAVLEPRRIAPRSILITTGLFTAALLVATVTSIDPVGSIVGQPGRFTGTVVVIGCLVVMLSITAAFGLRSLTVLGRLLTPVVAVIGVYALIQHLGADPFQWGTDSFGGESFSTVGNPNTAAGVAAIALPFVLWVMLDDRLVGSLRVGAGAIVGLSLGALVTFASFQGPVAALVSVLYLLAWAYTNGRTLGVWLIAVLAAVPIALLLVLPRRVATVATIAFIVYYVVLVFAIPWLERRRAAAALVERRRWVLGGAGVVAVVAAVLIGPAVAGVVADELADGLNERTAFYRAALDSFADTPVTGDGFETFVITFPEYRPAWHAERLERSRTASVHSIWLAMFQSGGVLLGGTYLALMVAVVAWLWRGIRRQPLAGGGLLLAAGGSLVASMVQGLVSIEHVVLYLLHFTAAGMIVALALEVIPATSTTGAAKAEALAGRSSKGRRPTPQRRVPVIAVGVTLVLAVVVTATVVVRPLRSQMAELRALRAGDAQDFPTALTEISDAIDLAPWALRSRNIRASLYTFLGDGDAAADDAEQLLQRSHGSVLALPVVPILIDQAETQIRRGQSEVALEQLRVARRWVRLLQANDPTAPRTRSDAVAMLVRIAALMQELGEPDAAQRTLAAAQQLDPTAAIPAAGIPADETAPDESDTDGEPLNQ